MSPSTITQEHPLGCGVACVAFRRGTSYADSLSLFAHPENAWSVGYYCADMVAALARAGLTYAFAEYDAARHSGLLSQEGTIVFIGACEKLPSGHYLIRAREGWMNPWSNFPSMVPARSAFQDSLPGTVTHVVYELKTQPAADG